MESVSSFSINIGTIAYGSAGLGYIVLVLLLATCWRGRLQGGLLVMVCLLSAVWGIVLATHAAYGYQASIWVFLVELCRNGLWLWFVLRLLSIDGSSEGKAARSVMSLRLRIMAWGIALFWVALTGVHILEWLSQGTFAKWLGYDLRLPGHLILAIVGLALVEQVFRNTHPEQRWAIKFLCLGLGGMFAYDFFLYSNAVLFSQLDLLAWDTRGFVQLLIIPLIAISAARNPQWSLDLFISRGVVFHTAAILATGVYLLVMALGGYLLQLFGGRWGGVIQLLFFSGAVLVLFVLMFSGQIRSRFKVFLSKHFFSYKYDYREEWLTFTKELGASGSEVRLRVIQAMANMVDSPGGAIWLREEGRPGFELGADWNVASVASYIREDSLSEYLQSSGWIVDLDEYLSAPEVYNGLRLPYWLGEIPGAWLIIPLFQEGELLGIMVLLQPRAPRNINWEDRDLLKTAASQAASYLALAEKSTELAHARQFEAFNRLSAYVVHDLKNVIGQLSLVVKNAEKFGDNPAFMADAMATVDNSVVKMQKMLSQLRQGRQMQQSSVAVKLVPLLNAVIENRSNKHPVPVLEIFEECGDVTVVAEKERLMDVIEHIVQNAQDATPEDGRISVRLRQDSSHYLIEVEDTGHGMDSAFIRDRLFKPFDTTKGNAGMGIGAYECREFFRAMGGNVVATSEPGIKTLFRLSVPRSVNMVP